MDEARPRTLAQLLGADAEELVARRLATGGWTILARNLRVGRAELDIVGIDPGPPHELVVVEVRYRARRDFGLAEETITHRKRQLLRGAIAALRERNALPALATRFDLVVVEPGSAGDVPRIRHHRHAL